MAYLTKQRVVRRLAVNIVISILLRCGVEDHGEVHGLVRTQPFVGKSAYGDTRVVETSSIFVAALCL